MIKILHVVASLIGGAGEHVYSLLSRTDTDRFRVHLIAPDDSPSLSERIEALGITWYKYPIDAGIKFMVIPRIRSIIKQEGIDIVHSHGIRGALYGRLGGVFTKSCAVYTVHGFHPAHYQSALKKSLAIALEKILARWATDIIICVSNSDMEEVKSHLSIAPEDKMVLIQNGIDVEWFKDAHATGAGREEFLSSKSQVLLGTVGRLRPQKSMETLVDLARILKEKGWEFRLLIIGEGPQKEMLRAKIESAGLENDVLLTGYREDVADILKSLDLFLLSSLWEGLPLVLLEALAAGVPIVATQVPGTEELLEPVYGENMASGGDPDSFVKILQDWRDSPDKWDQMAKQGQKMVMDHYGIKDMVKKTENVYNHLLSSKNEDINI